MIYAQPGTHGAVFTPKTRYGNYIGGEFIPPTNGAYFTNSTPVTGQVIAEFPAPPAKTLNSRSMPPMQPQMLGGAPRFKTALWHC